MHDVVAPAGERQSQVGAYGDRHAHARPAGDRDRRADGDDLLVGAALQRPAPREQVARARRRRQHGHLVAEPPQRGGGSLDVRVHLVRLRPRERRDEADAEAHARPKLQLVTWRHGRGHDQGARQRPVQDRGSGAGDRCRRARVRAPGRKRVRSLPLRALAHEALLRQESSARRLRRGRLRTARPSRRSGSGWSLTPRDDRGLAWPDPDLRSQAFAAAFAFLTAFFTMNRSLCSCASSSRICFGGDFMR